MFNTTFMPDLFKSLNNMIVFKTLYYCETVKYNNI